MSNGNDLLMGGGVPWASFLKEGDSITGSIKSDPTSRQSRSLETGDRMTWPNGDPVMEIVVMLQTELRDPEIDYDDGTRQLVINKPAMRTAIRDAVRKAGAAGIEPGGVLTVTYTSTEKPKSRGVSGAKQFSATYVPPAQGLLMKDDNLTEDEALARLQSELPSA